MNEFSHSSPVSELNDTGGLREKGIVLSFAHIHAGLDPRASLAHDDRTPGDHLTAEAFDTQSFRIAIPAVSGASSRFFYCVKQLRFLLYPNKYNLNKF